MSNAAEKKRDADWQRRLLAGDHCAFAEFVDKYKESVFLCCRVLRLRHDEAEDVASETFLAAYKGLSRYKGDADLGTWLWRIAYNKAIDFIRSKGRKVEVLIDADFQFEEKRGNVPVAEMEACEKNEIIWDAVMALPKEWSIAAILFYREGKSVKEIADITETGQNTVKTYLFRAREWLRQSLPLTIGGDFNVD